jgi:hypothetical protein
VLHPGGFKIRVDELNRRATGSEEYRRRRDSWYAKNQAVATTAVTGVLSPRSAALIWFKAVEG